MLGLSNKLVVHITENLILFQTSNEEEKNNKKNLEKSLLFYDLYTAPMHIFLKASFLQLYFKLKRKDSYWPFVNTYVISCWELIT